MNARQHRKARRSLARFIAIAREALDGMNRAREADAKLYERLNAMVRDAKRRRETNLRPSA